MIVSMPAPQRARLMQPHYNVHLNIQMVPSGGGIFNPTDRLLSGKINASMDQTCATLELTFNRGKGGIAAAFDNLSPLIATSDWNASGPLMYGGNFISLECCITEPGVAPDVFTSFFIGRVDTVDIGGDEVVITARDGGAYALDRQIKYAFPYEAGPMDDVMKFIMASNGFDPGTYWYQEIADPEYTIVKDMQQPGSLLEALRVFAQQRGLDFRYLKRNGRLTLYDPDRDRVTVDATFSANEYMTVDRLRLDDVDVRNQIEVWYGQGTAGVGRVYLEDAASMLQHGPRFCRIVMGRSKNVINLIQATAFAGYAMSDMKDPLADHQITLPFFPIVELNDFYEYVANQDHYDTNQKWAISGYSHDFSLENSVTTFQTRGKPMAAFRDYRRGGEDMLVISTEDAPTATYLDGAYFPEGYMWGKTPDLTIP